MNKSDFIDKTIKWVKSIVFQEYPGASKERIITDDMIEKYKKIMETYEVKVDCRVTYSYSFETEVDEETFNQLEKLQEYGPVDADFSDYQSAVDLIMEHDNYYDCKVEVDSVEYNE